MRWLAIALGALATAAPAAAAPDCDPAVRVSGDPALARSIRDSLAERGVAIDGTALAGAGCPRLDARIERRGDRLRVSVTDGYGRKSQRDVRDATTAVALIESWMRPEVVGDDLPGVPTSAATAPAPAVATVIAREPAPSRLALELSGGPVVAGDDSTWWRGELAACARLGPTCTGVALGYADDAQLGGMSLHPRWTSSAAATVELPFTVGRNTAAPGLAVALAWNRVDGTGPHLDQHVDFTDLRIDVAVALRHRLTARWSVVLDLAGGHRLIGGDASLPASGVRGALGVRFGGR